MGRIRLPSLLALVGGVALVAAVPALATNIPVLHYDPPKIKFQDLPGTPSTEHLTVTKQGSDFVFATSVGTAPAPGNEPGCTDTTDTMFHCPVAGIRKIVINLGLLGDTATIDLGSKADKVKQVLNGGEDPDELQGGPGKQKLNGDAGGDTLIGGPGPDVLDGGPGDDACDGGPGKDELRSCEGPLPG